MGDVRAPINAILKQLNRVGRDVKPKHFGIFREIEVDRACLRDRFFGFKQGEQKLQR